MNLFKIIFNSSKEYEKLFIDGRTKFVLSSIISEGKNIFQNTNCNLIKTYKYKKNNYYLVETNVDFTGIDFGFKAVSINKFYVVIRRPSNFRVDKNNDVLVYSNEDISDLLDFKVNKLKLVNWAYMHDITN